jgi:hypothetical protein
VDKDAGFAMQVGRLGLERFLQGYGYEVTFGDVLDACDHFLVAAQRCGLEEPATQEALALANAYRSKLPNLLADALIRKIAGIASHRQTSMTNVNRC